MSCWFVPACAGESARRSASSVLLPLEDVFTRDSLHPTCDLVQVLYLRVAYRRIRSRRRGFTIQSVSWISISPTSFRFSSDQALLIRHVVPFNLAQFGLQKKSCPSSIVSQVSSNRPDHYRMHVNDEDNGQSCMYTWCWLWSGGFLHRIVFFLISFSRMNVSSLSCLNHLRGRTSFCPRGWRASTPSLGYPCSPPLSFCPSTAS